MKETVLSQNPIKGYKRTGISCWNFEAEAMDRDESLLAKAKMVGVKEKYLIEEWCNRGSV